MSQLHLKRTDRSEEITDDQFAFELNEDMTLVQRMRHMGNIDDILRADALRWNTAKATKYERRRALFARNEFVTQETSSFLFEAGCK